MDDNFIDSQGISSHWIESEVYEIFKSIIIERRDKFFEMTVDFELSQVVRDDARRRGTRLNNFLTECDNAWSCLEYDKTVIDKLKD